MRRKLLFLFGLAVAPLASRAQANNPLSTAQLRRVAEHCVRKVHPDTIEAIAKQESGLFPYSLSINYPKTEAKHMGFANAEYQLSRQPRTRREAIAWTRWFLQHGHSVSIGLMQVSSEQARQLGITDLSELFDPCVNLAAGAWNTLSRSTTQAQFQLAPTTDTPLAFWRRPHPSLFSPHLKLPLSTPSDGEQSRQDFAARSL